MALLVCCLGLSWSSKLLEKGCADTGGVPSCQSPDPHGCRRGDWSLGLEGFDARERSMRDKRLPTVWTLRRVTLSGQGEEEKFRRVWRSKKHQGYQLKGGVGAGTGW